MNALRQRLQNFTERLNPREHLIVMITAGAVLFFLVYTAILMPLANSVHWASRRVSDSTAALEQANRLVAKYEKVQADLAVVEKQIQAGPHGNLLTQLESLATSSKVKVDSMQPQSGASNEFYRETRVQIELKGVTLAQLVQYLFAIENAPQRISVKSLRVNRRKDQGSLDASFSVSSFQPV